VFDELERIRKEAAVTYFKVLMKNLPPKGTEETHRKFSLESWSTSQDLQNKEQVLTTTPRSQIVLY
jgi:hypothetical protein